MSPRKAGMLLRTLALASVAILVLGEEQCSQGRRLVAPDGAELELVQAVVVHRHGDRTPIAKHAGKFHQTDDLEEFWRTRVSPADVIERWGRLNVDATKTHLEKTASDRYTYPNGHLTVLGANQLRRVGSELRERYIGDLGFLPSDLPSDHSGSGAPLVYTRSTRIPRTVQSLQNLLLGLYPEDHRPRDAASQTQGTIVIETQPKDSDYMTGMSEKRCPRIKALMQDPQLPKNLADLVARLNKVLGESGNVETEGLAGSKSQLIDRWIHLGDIGTCHAAHRLDQPLNISASDLVQVQEYNAWMWGRRLEESVELNALAIGGFLKDMLQVFADTVAGKAEPGSSAPKLAVFSGHDSTLFPILTALGAFNGHWPPYASRIQLELLRVVPQVPWQPALAPIALPFYMY